MRADAPTEQAVLAALERWNAAFAARDVEEAVGLFDGHPDAVMFGSEDYEVARGSADIRKLFERLFALPLTFQWRWDVCDVFRAGDVAWAAAETTLVASGENGAEEMPYRVTAVLVLRDDGWAWAHFHGAQPVPTG